MFIAKLQLIDDAYTVVLPQEEVERLGLNDGDEIGLEIAKVRDNYTMSPDVAAALKWALERYAADLEYLKDH